MSREQRKFPIPKVDLRGKNYRIRWYAFENPFEFSLGPVTKSFAEALCLALGAAFAGRVEYPEEVRNEPAIKRYLALAENLKTGTPDDELISRYINHLKANSMSSWPRTVKTYLTKASEHCGSIQEVTTADLLEFLDLIASQNSNATRNRAHAALSGFYKWLRVIGYVPKHHNPMSGIQQITEERPHDGIVVWEANEIRPLLDAVNTLRDGIAVWIAIYSGMRRSEIARLKWVDIADAYIIVGKSKTSKKRQIPLAKILDERLAHEKRSGTGKVVPWPDKHYGWEIAATRLVKEYLPRLLPGIHKANPEKFGWNAFRHTFASRHAQAGLSLDIIAAWLGDSPKVCKEHYARYVPKNVRDSRIDAVDL